MQDLNLVTVVGHNITMLPHMLEYYQQFVEKKNIFIVVYRQDENDGILEQIENLGLTPYKVVTEPKFHWEKVTELYNEVKMTKPNDWWIVSDDDEIQIYPKPIEEMIDECEVKGWEFITGGFLDRIGEDGSFPIVDSETNIWEVFPYSGFFRYPLSGACPNKVCVMKGKIQITNGQHYAHIDGKDVWGKEGVEHPLRYPPGRGEGFIQVHHFKWDSTVLERLKEVSETEEDYTFWKEYKKMYKAIEVFDWKIDINNPLFGLVRNIPIQNEHWDYQYWNRLTKGILKI
tara:strand:- start:2502 stop:3362 length:861 start_codon:yes stop_codon:yes gene_type:complete